MYPYRWSMVVVAFIAALVFGGGGPQAMAGIKTRMMLSAIELPPGFAIDVYAEEVHGARSMAMSPSGVLFVGTRQSGRVYAVVDRDRNGRADAVYVIAEGLNMPNGVAFRDGDLYVAEVDRILRFGRIEAHLELPLAPEVVSDRFPKSLYQGWRVIRFGPDGRLYVTLGASCDVCMSDDALFAAIGRMNPDGSGFEVIARGVRHSLGLDWHPRSGALWFTDIGPRSVSMQSVPDELNRADVKGLHFGFPHCHGGSIVDARFGHDQPCTAFTPPALRLEPRVNASGIRFYKGRMFPQPYYEQIFIAEHGSSNHPEKRGHRIMRVTLRDERVVGYDAFAQGWLIGDVAWGRPVDVEIMGDGSLLVSDDQNGVIYRITYRPPEAAIEGRD